jgi:RHS repeat-associated protein
MQEVAQGTQVDEAQVPQGTAIVSVQGSAGTSVSLAAPSLGTTTTRGGGIIVPQCTKHALNTYYATDHLGTVRFTKTIDDTGAVTTTTHDYEPFGVEITPTDECDNTHRFTGHERDLETGNDYMHFRFFSSNMGRFQKPDSNFDNPIANPQGWNLYSYVKGNPVNFNDPTGHQAYYGMSAARSAEADNGLNEGIWDDTGASLQNYLWGGAELTEKVTHYTATDQSGNVVDWGVISGTPSVVSGGGGVLDSQELSQADPVRAYIQVAVNLARKYGKEVEFAIPKVDGKPAGPAIYQIGNFVNTTGFGQKDSLQYFAAVARGILQRPGFMGGTDFTMDVGHTHPEPDTLIKVGQPYYDQYKHTMVNATSSFLYTGVPDFSREEAAAMKAMPHSQEFPYIDRVMVARGDIVRYYGY